MKILDATASIRSMWYQKNYPDTIFFDKRNGKVFDDRIMKNHIIKPMINGLWEYLPFKDSVFDMVVFDPPHVISNRTIKTVPNMSHRYGLFYKDNWRHELESGIKELFRVLKPKGTFILKWCECEKDIKDVLVLFPYRPVFGTQTGTLNNTHWIVFIKNRFDSQLSDYT